MGKIKWIQPLYKMKMAVLSTGNKLSLDDLYAERLLPVLDKKNAKPKEELLMLLKVAAEVEQSLLIQYLMTAYSIKDDTGTNPLRNAILSVAIQEMGHFLCVQNLLLFVGGLSNLHLTRTSISAAFPFPFMLEPISKQVLAKFVIAEAPDPVPKILEEEVLAIAQDTADGTVNKIDPVGLLYQKIFWIFQKDDTPVAGPGMMQLSPSSYLPAGFHLAENDWSALSDIDPFEAETNTWTDPHQFGPSAKNARHVIFQDVKSRADALTAVNAIALQGEGADLIIESKNSDPSHFETFLFQYQHYNDAFAGSSPANTIVSFTKNPVTDRNTPYPDASLITNPYSLLWARLFNTVFSSLLMDIYSSMFYSINKDKFIQLTHSTMTNIISQLSQMLIRLPLTGNNFSYDQGPLCGPTYEIDALVTISTVKADVDRINKMLLDNITQQTQSIQNDPLFQAHQNADFNVFGYLNSISNYTAQKNNLINN